jgi:hypothetical protein
MSLIFQSRIPIKRKTNQPLEKLPGKTVLAMVSALDTNSDLKRLQLQQYLLRCLSVLEKNSL